MSKQGKLVAASKPRWQWTNLRNSFLYPCHDVLSQHLRHGESFLPLSSSCFFEVSCVHNMKLGYWDIRGLGQPIRYMLAFKEVEFEDKLYSFGPPPDCDRSSWLNEKFELGLDFPNLPYLIDGDVKLTQSLAIMRYLARKLQLDAETDEEKRRVDLAEQQINDVGEDWGEICYSPDFAEERDGYEAKLPHTLEALSNFLGGRPFFAGERLTYVDFLAYETLAQLLLFSRKSFANAKNLTDYIDRVEQLPTLKSYLQSDACIKWPIMGDTATYASRHSEKLV